MSLKRLRVFLSHEELQEDSVQRTALVGSESPGLHQSHAGHICVITARTKSQETEKDFNSKEIKRISVRKKNVHFMDSWSLSGCCRQLQSFYCTFVKCEEAEWLIFILFLFHFFF